MGDVAGARHSKPPHRSRKFDDLLIINAGHRLRNCDHIVSGVANPDDHGKIATLVGNQAHSCGADRSAGGAEDDLFVRQEIAAKGVGKLKIARTVGVGASTVQRVLTEVPTT